MNSNEDAKAVLPKEALNAPEQQPAPRFSRNTEIEFFIKNHTVLQSIASKYNTTTLLPDAPTTSSAHMFYQKLNTSERIEIDYGTFMEIDVQSDMRFMTQYFMFTTAQEYPDFDVKGFPYTSLPSLVAYKIALTIGHFLICDLTCKNTRSRSATPYVSDPAFIELLTLLKQCPVPDDVRTLLEYLAPVKDTQRQNLKFVPTFAGFSFSHDFGYSVPIHAFLIIHNILATNRSNADPNLTMFKIYTSVIANINGQEYTIAHLFGGPFQHGMDAVTHRNWFSLALETFINPVVARALVQRPTFAKTAVEIEEYDTAPDVNGYHYLLGYPVNNELMLNAFLTDVARFYTSRQSSLIKLGVLLEQATGVTILTHSIESYVLPTWHHLPPITVTDAEKSPPVLTPMNDVQYAALINYRCERPSFTGTFPYPEDPETIEVPLYRVRDEAFDPDRCPIKYPQFNPRTDIYSNVLWFQPYDKSSQSIELALTLGFKIISDEIDGVVIPLPDEMSDLTDNNSSFLQGSIPITVIRPYLPSTDATNTIPIYSRVRHHIQSQPLGFAVRDCTHNVLPIMGNDAVRAPQPTQFGMIAEHRHNDPTEASTIVCWKRTEEAKIAKNRLLLWSSFRYIDQDCYSDTQAISFFYTLRALTGTCITLSRTQHPSKLIPS